MAKPLTYRFVEQTAIEHSIETLLTKASVDFTHVSSLGARLCPKCSATILVICFGEQPVVIFVPIDLSPQINRVGRPFFGLHYCDCVAPEIASQPCLGGADTEIGPAMAIVHCLDAMLQPGATEEFLPSTNQVDNWLRITFDVAGEDGCEDEHG